MTLTKFVIGQIVVAFGLVTLGLWAATQRAAPILAYCSKLGSPLLELDRFPLYRHWPCFALALSVNQNLIDSEFREQLMERMPNPGGSQWALGDAPVPWNT